MKAENNNKKLMTENEVKKKMKVKDFSDLTKNKALEFVKILGNMTSEIGIEALDSSKNVVNTIKDSLLEIKKSYDFALKSSSDSQKEINENHTKMIDSLISMLNKKDLSFEEKKYIIESYKEIQSMQNNKDSEHLKFKNKFASGVGKTAAAIGGAIVGVAVAIKLKK